MLDLGIIEASKTRKPLPTTYLDSFLVKFIHFF